MIWSVRLRPQRSAHTTSYKRLGLCPVCVFKRAVFSASGAQYLQTTYLAMMEYQVLSEFFKGHFKIIISLEEYMKGWIHSPSQRLYTTANIFETLLSQAHFLKWNSGLQWCLLSFLPLLTLNIFSVVTIGWQCCIGLFFSLICATVIAVCVG